MTMRTELMQMGRGPRVWGNREGGRGWRGDEKRRCTVYLYSLLTTMV